MEKREEKREEKWAVRLQPTSTQKPKYFIR
jgi:hypothetical protein